MRIDPATLAAALALGLSFTAAAQDAEPRPIQDAGRIDRVVVYPRGAAVTRAIRRDLEQGVWVVRVTGLPRGVDPSQLQARVRTDDAAGERGARLLGVEYEETSGTGFAGSAEGIELAERLRAAEQALGRAAQDRAQLAGADARIAQVATRIVANATAEGATAASDAGRTLGQLAWAAAERAKLLEEVRALTDRQEALEREVEALRSTITQRGAADRTQRTALVRVAAPRPGALDLEVTYTVPDAAWAPAYSIRAEGDRSGASLEYDAMIAQRSGEEWNDVRLSLSTADPARSARPGEVEPVYVDVLRPQRAPAAYGSAGEPRMRSRTGGALGAPGRPGAGLRKAKDDSSGGDDAALAEAIEQLAAAAPVAEAGIAASFELPRRVTVPSDGARTQRQRITTIEPEVRFTYAAQPLVDEQVYLRGDMKNASGYQVLPGTARVFMGGDFIGETPMPAVAPGSEFKVSFGPDRAVRATREVVSKLTGNAGLFGGSAATTWKYRVRIDNGTGRDIRVELLDRRPVSRNDRIEVRLADLSVPLCSDAEYATGPQKAGILRWDLAVPAAARGTAALPVTWTVQATHARDVETTPLPD